MRRISRNQITRLVKDYALMADLRTHKEDGTTKTKVSPHILRHTAWLPFHFLLIEMKRYGEAKEYYEKAVELRSDDLRTHYNYAIFLREMERNHEAEKHYRITLEIEPDFLQSTSLNLCEKMWT